MPKKIVKVRGNLRKKRRGERVRVKITSKKGVNSLLEGVRGGIKNDLLEPE